MKNSQIKNASANLSIDNWVRNIPWRLHIIVTSIGLFIILTVSYGFNISYNMVEKYTPLIDAAMEVKLEVTTAHLLLEELINGDHLEDLEKLNLHFKNAQWYAMAMLKGGENQEGRFIPLTDQNLRNEIERVYQKIVVFQKITNQRLKNIKKFGAGTIIDQRYDNIFNDVISQADRVENALQAEIISKTEILKVIQITVILFTVLSIALIIWVFYHFERRRSSDMQLVTVTNDHLQKALEEVETLQGIIPICGYCKSIRDEEGLWKKLEAYIHSHSAAEFSHGICPDCYKEQIKKLKNRV